MNKNVWLGLLALLLFLAAAGLAVNIFKSEPPEESSSVTEKESTSSTETEGGEIVELPEDAVVPNGETLHAFWNAVDIPNLPPEASVGFAPRIECLPADAVLTIPFEGTTQNAKYIVRFCVSDCERVSENGTLTFADTTLTYTRVTDVDVYRDFFVSEYTVTSKGADYDELFYTPGQSIDLEWVMITRVTE